jgi:hypothetical protein
MTLISREQILIVAGATRTVDRYAATKLPSVGPATVPFPAQLSGVPVGALLTRIGNGCPGPQVTFDSSQGAADASGALSGGKLGYDQNNVYLFVSCGTECIVTVEY